MFFKTNPQTSVMAAFARDTILGIIDEPELMAGELRNLPLYKARNVDPFDPEYYIWGKSKEVDLSSYATMIRVRYGVPIDVPITDEYPEWTSTAVWNSLTRDEKSLVLSWKMFLVMLVSANFLKPIWTLSKLTHDENRIPVKSLTTGSLSNVDHIAKDIAVQMSMAHINSMSNTILATAKVEKRNESTEITYFHTPSVVDAINVVIHGIRDNMDAVTIALNEAQGIAGVVAYLQGNPSTELRGAPYTTYITRWAKHPTVAFLLKHRNLWDYYPLLADVEAARTVLHTSISSRTYAEGIFTVAEGLPILDPKYAVNHSEVSQGELRALHGVSSMVRLREANISKDGDILTVEKTIRVLNGAVIVCAPHSRTLGIQTRPAARYDVGIGGLDMAVQAVTMPANFLANVSTVFEGMKTIMTDFLNELIMTTDNMRHFYLAADVVINGKLVPYDKNADNWGTDTGAVLKYLSWLFLNLFFEEGYEPRATENPWGYKFVTPLRLAGPADLTDLGITMSAVGGSYVNFILYPDTLSQADEITLMPNEDVIDLFDVKLDNGVAAAWMNFLHMTMLSQAKSVIYHSGPDVLTSELPIPRLNRYRPVLLAEAESRDGLRLVPYTPTVKRSAPDFLYPHPGNVSRNSFVMGVARTADPFVWVVPPSSLNTLRVLGNVVNDLAFTYATSDFKNALMYKITDTLLSISSAWKYNMIPWTTAMPEAAYESCLGHYIIGVFDAMYNIDLRNLESYIDLGRLRQELSASENF